MDAQSHQPGEELADFTEGELLSLIDAGTAGAYSEIYRRYIDDALARASFSLPSAEARKVADEAFLSVLRSTLNDSAATSESLQSAVDDTIDECLADLKVQKGSSSSATKVVGEANGADGADGADVADELDSALVAEAFSTLPDNWQRILWLREVERLSPEAVAGRLNIDTEVVDRLSLRAHEDLQKTWARTRPKGSIASVDHRSTLIPALLMSPIVIERLADTIAQAPPSPIASAGSTGLARSTKSTTAAPAESTESTSAASAGSFEPALEDAATVSIDAMPPAEETTEADTTPTTALDTSPGPVTASVATSVGTSSRSTFTMPKPVLIPVIAACIGLLGTLVGLAIVPDNTEHTGIRSGGKTSAASTVDATGGASKTSRNAHSPDSTDPDTGTSSDTGSREQRSKNQPSSPDSRNAAENKDGDSPSTKGSASTKSRDDDVDRPAPKEPDEPRPSDPDRPGSKSPSEPAPSAPEPSESEPPSDPNPESPTDPAPSEDPPSSNPAPSDPAPSDPAPTNDPNPSDPAPTEPAEPDEPTDDPAASDAPPPSGSNNAPAADSVHDTP